MSSKRPASGTQNDEEPDPEFDQLLVDVQENPTARAIYEDTVQRAALLASGVSARKEKRLTQKALASVMRTTQSAVSDLESGRVEPQLSTLQRYARALGRRFDFAFVDREVPADHEAISNTLFQQSEGGGAKSPPYDPREAVGGAGADSEGLADAILLPQRLIRPLLSLLQAEGWTRLIGEGEERRYALIDEAANVIGISVERDRIVGVLVDMDGDVIRDGTTSLLDQTHATVIGAISDVVVSLYEKSERRVLGVGVGLAGIVDAITGKVSFAPDLQSADDPWTDVDLEKELEDHFKSGSALRNYEWQWRTT